MGEMPSDEFKRSRDDIRNEIERRGWNTSLESYTQVLEGQTLDACALLMAAYGFEDASSERMQKTQQ